MIAAVLSLGITPAMAGTWWSLDTKDGRCVTADEMARVVRDPSYATPFTLAEEMRQAGRSNGPIQQKRTSSGSAYGVPYDGVMTAFFTNKAGCGEFLRSARKHGDLP